MACRDRLEDGGHVGERVDPVQLAGLNERGDPRPAMRALVVASEEGVLPLQAEGADRVFDGVAVDLDTAVIEEDAESSQWLAK